MMKITLARRLWSIERHLIGAVNMATQNLQQLNREAERRGRATMTPLHSDARALLENLMAAQDGHAASFQSARDAVLKRSRKEVL